MNNAKHELRTRIRAEQKLLSAQVRESMDERLIQNVLGNDLYQECDRIFLYASVGTEINTRSLIRLSNEAGKIVALPKCRAEGIMDFYRYTGKLAEGKYRIPEPTGSDVLYPQSSDIMIVPGLAFDVAGFRIGQGGGYYDRYLSKHNCICIGLCRDQFLMEEIPTMWNDIPVDYVITENAVYNCKKRSF